MPVPNFDAIGLSMWPPGSVIQKHSMVIPRLISFLQHCFNLGKVESSIYFGGICHALHCLFTYLLFSSISCSCSSHEDSLPIKRTTRLALMRARLRRRLVQLRRNLNTNASLQHYHRKISETLLDAVRESPSATVAAILSMKEKEDALEPEK